MHIAERTSVAAQFACRIHVIDILPNLVPTLLSLLPPLRVSTKVLNFVYMHTTSLPPLFSYQLIANEVLYGNQTSSTIPLAPSHDTTTSGIWVELVLDDDHNGRRMVPLSPRSSSQISAPSEHGTVVFFPLV